MEITINELRQMKHKEGMILQGCGGDIQEWVNGINELLTQEDISRAGCWPWRSRPARARRS